MADYEIQKDFGKALDWLSHVKEQAYQGVDSAYKEIKTSATKEQKPPPARLVSATETTEGTLVALVAYGLLGALILFFLYRDKDSWLRQSIAGFQRSRKDKQANSIFPPDS